MLVYLSERQSRWLKELADEEGVKPNELLGSLVELAYLNLLKENASRLSGLKLSAEERTLPLFPGLAR